MGVWLIFLDVVEHYGMYCKRRHDTTTVAIMIVSNGRMVGGGGVLGCWVEGGMRGVEWGGKE